MKDRLSEYYDKICENLQTILTNEKPHIDEAAETIVDQLEKDKLLYVIGTGAHSMMVAMEMFKRAGGLAQVSPLFPPGLGDFEGHPKTERLTGYASYILDYYRVAEGDLLIIGNVNGINSLTIDTALECSRRGIKTIGITSTTFSRGVPKDSQSRHPSNKDLCDICDIVIDTYIPPGDALIHFDDSQDLKGVPVGPGSTYPMVFVVNSLVIRVVEKQLERGTMPEIRKSGNLPGGLERSKRLFDHKYYHRIKHY